MTPPSTYTCVFQIGNTDNKLTQQEWSLFCDEFMRLVTTYSEAVHFCGGPSTWSTYQNLCMVSTIRVTKEDIEEFNNCLIELRKKYRQDSIAVTSGITTFI